MSNVTLKVREVAEQKGVENPFALAKLTGLGYAVCHRMWNGETTLIALETISKLCEALECTPNDLLVFTSAKKSKDKK